MRYALIIVFGVCYYAGWLPASFVVPALLVISALRLPNSSAGRTPRRPGYIRPPSNASGNESQGTAARVATYTGFSTQPGNPSADVRAAFQVPLGGSRTTVPGSYMSEWGFAPGRLTTAAKRGPDWLPDYRAQLGFPPVGDCGCGDTAA